MLAYSSWQTIFHAEASQTDAAGDGWFVVHVRVCADSATQWARPPFHIGVFRFISRTALKLHDRDRNEAPGWFAVYGHEFLSWVSWAFNFSRTSISGSLKFTREAPAYKRSPRCTFCLWNESEFQNQKEQTIARLQAFSRSRLSRISNFDFN
jgi:hypothetical protein